MKVLKKTLAQFPSDLTGLDCVLSWFDQLKESSIPTIVWLQCELALAEGFTNAVRHAHKGLQQERNIDIEVTLFPELLEIRIWDWGLPFDLEQKLRNMPEMVSETAGGGRGLAILQKIADVLSYKRTDDNRNCLLIIKNY